MTREELRSGRTEHPGDPFEGGVEGFWGNPLNGLLMGLELESLTGLLWCRGCLRVVYVVRGGERKVKIVVDGK